MATIPGAAVPTAFTPPATDKVIGSASFTPPATDKVVGAADSSFTPPATDKVLGNADVVTTLARPVDDLVNDSNFSPRDFYNQNSTVLTPEQVSLLGKVYQGQSEKLLPSSVGSAASDVAKGVSGAATGAYQMGKAVAKMHPLYKLWQLTKSSPGAVFDQSAAETLGGLEQFGEGVLEMGRSAVRQGVNRLFTPGVGKEMAAAAAGPTLGAVVREIPNLPVNADVLHPSNFLQPQDWTQRLINDAAVLQQGQKVSQVQGAMAEAAGLDAKTLADEGIIVDPDVAAGIANGVWFALPAVAGGLTAVPRAAGAVDIIDSAGAKVATANSIPAANSFISSAAQFSRAAAQGTLQKVAAGAGKVDAAATSAMSKVLHSPAAVAIGAITGTEHLKPLLVTAGSALGVKYGAKGVQLAAQLLGSDAAMDAAGTLTKGAAGGAAAMAPFAATSDGTPDEKLQQLAMGATFGAGGAVAVKTPEVVAKGQAKASEILNRAAWDTAQVPDVPNAKLSLSGLDNFETETQNMLKKSGADQQDLNKFNVLRTAAAAQSPDAPPVLNRKPVGIYWVSPEFAAKVDPGLQGKEGVFNLPVKDANGGTQNIVALIGEGGLNALTHEPGHVVASYLKASDPKTLQSLLDAIPQETKDALQKQYLKRDLTPEQVTAIKSNPHYFDDEIAAEVLGHQFEGRSMPGVPATFRQQVARVTSGVLDRLGLFNNAPTAANMTRGMQVPVTPTAGNLGEKVVKQWFSDPDVKAALDALSKQKPEPATPSVQTPQNAAPAQPATTSLVTPEHEKVLAGLQKAIPGKAYNKLASIADKLRNGQTLTDTEKKLWQGVDEAAGLPSQPAPAQPALVQPAAEVPPSPAAPTSAAPPVIQPAPKAAEVPPVIEPAPKPEEIPAPTAKPEAEVPTPTAKKSPEAPPSLRNTPEEVAKFTGPARQPAQDRVQDALKAVQANPNFTPEQKTAVASLLTNLRTPHDVVYNAAKNVSGMDRTSRREDIEAARSNPELRAVASKLSSIPLDARKLNNGDVQLQFWSGDKVVSNVREAVAKIAAAGQEKEIPYATAQGKLTDEGQAELASDLQKYTANQDNGYRGDGQKLVRPENPEGFIPDENPDYKPQPIAADKAEFLNLLMGERPPKTARVTEGVVPIQARAKKLAAANSREGIVVEPAKKYKAPFADVTLSDYNPLRHRLQKAGVDLSGLTEAHEWVNAKDIKSATPRPDIKLSPTSTDVTAAGFLPAETADKVRLRPALLIDGNPVTGGDSHAEILQNIREQHPTRDQLVKALGAFLDDDAHVFVDPSGRVYNRNEAAQAIGHEGPLHSEALGDNRFLPAQKSGTGRENDQFFSDVAAGKFGKSDVPFTPTLDLSDVHHVAEEFAKHAGNFADHIRKSIPIRYEQQVRTVDGIVKTFPKGARLLDIGSSEGYWGKTVSALSKGKIETVSLDPNEQMASDFASISKVPGASFTTDAFLNGFEGHEAHNPAEPYDIVHEDMTFQFIDPDRAPQFAEVKRMLKPGGLFITAEKVTLPPDQWKANELKKDRDFKAKYFSKKELADKDARVGFSQSKQETQAVGMTSNQASAETLEKVLHDNFKHVVQYWDSGNFRGYAASDNPRVLQKFVENTGDLNSDYSTVQTPRLVDKLNASADTAGNAATAAQSTEALRSDAPNRESAPQGGAPAEGAPSEDGSPNTRAGAPASGDQQSPLLGESPKYLPAAQGPPFYSQLERTIQKKFSGKEGSELYHGSMYPWSGQPRLNSRGVFWLTPNKDHALEGYTGNGAKGATLRKFSAQLGNVADLSKLRGKLEKIYSADKDILADPETADGFVKGDPEYLLLNSPDVLAYLKRNGFDSAKVDEGDGRTSFAVFSTDGLKQTDLQQFLPAKKAAVARDDMDRPLLPDGSIDFDRWAKEAEEADKRRDAERDQDLARWIQPKSAKRAEPDQKLTAWILPDGKLAPLVSDRHEQDLASNSAKLNQKFGTKFMNEVSESDRINALNAGFVRVRNYAGKTSVEVNSDFWDRQKAPLLKHLIAHSDSIDRLDITLVNAKGHAVDSATDATIFRASDPEQAIRDLVSEVKTPSAETFDIAPRNPGIIARARALPGPEDFSGIRFLPRRANPAEHRETQPTSGPVPVTLIQPNRRRALDGIDIKSRNR